MAEAKFEKDIERLEKVVAALEEGGLSLDDAVKKFEEGVKLAKRCESALNTAEKRIEKLTKDSSGKPVAEPFDEEGETDGEASDEDEDEEDEDGEDEMLF